MLGRADDAGPVPTAAATTGVLAWIRSLWGLAAVAMFADHPFKVVTRAQAVQ